MTKTKLFLGLAGLALGLALVACAPSLTWVTPKGQEFTNPTCDYSEPSKDGGPPICYARHLGNMSGAKGEQKEAQCIADHGYVTRSVFLMGEGSCYFPHADVGKSCRKASDCEVGCDAETKTCRDSQLGGELLDEKGRPVPGAVE